MTYQEKFDELLKAYQKAFEELNTLWLQYRQDGFDATSTASIKLPISQISFDLAESALTTLKSEIETRNMGNNPINPNSLYP